MTKDQDAVSRLASGLIRLSQVLATTTSIAARSQGLSQLQLAILSILVERKFGEPVGFFARRFMISAATVSDSIRVLAAKGLITKTRDRDDARSVFVAITEAGHEAVKQSASGAEKVRRILSEWDESRRAEVLPAVIALVDGLQKEGVDPVDRMCTNCRHFAINCDLESQSAPYYCRFLDIPLRTIDLRVDCPDFDPQPQS